MHRVVSVRVIRYMCMYSAMFTCLSRTQQTSAEQIKQANRAVRGVHFKEVRSNRLQAAVEKQIVKRPDNGKWMCTKCNTVLKQKAGYTARRSHVFACEKKMRKRFSGPYVCLVDACGHRLYHQGSIMAHIQLQHVAKKNYQYACSVCEKRYAIKTQALGHALRQHGNNRGVIVDRRTGETIIPAEKRHRVTKSPTIKVKAVRQDLPFQNNELEPKNSEELQRIVSAHASFSCEVPSFWPEDDLQIFDDGWAAKPDKTTEEIKAEDVLGTFLHQRTLAHAQRSRELFSPTAMRYLNSGSPLPIGFEQPGKNSQLGIN